MAPFHQAIVLADPDLLAAVAAGLPMHTMSAHELTHLPQFLQYKQLYVQLRNAILGLWQQDVNTPLVWKRVEAELMEEHRLVRGALCMFSL